MSPEGKCFVVFGETSVEKPKCDIPVTLSVIDTETLIEINLAAESKCEYSRQGLFASHEYGLRGYNGRHTSR